MKNEQITSFEARPGTEPTYSSVFRCLVGGKPAGYYATVTCDPGTIRVSKLDGETRWTIDALIRANGVPAWVNGDGARCVATKRLKADTPLTAELDAKCIR